MSRRISFTVAAAGATLLFALTGCATQQPASATPDGSSAGSVASAGSAAPASAGLCAVLAGPVAAALAQNGITATPVSDGSSSSCKWEDQASGTTVVLKMDSSAPAGGGQTVNVPGLGQVTVVAPGELAFTAGGTTYDLAVNSKASDEVDSKTAGDVAGAIGGVAGSLQGGATGGSGSGGSGSSDSGSDSDSTGSADSSDAPTGS